jgi:hypothetical protein
MLRNTYLRKIYVYTHTHTRLIYLDLQGLLRASHSILLFAKVYYIWQTRSKKEERRSMQSIHLFLWGHGAFILLSAPSGRPIHENRTK